MLTRMRKAEQTAQEQDQGFTLIELLVVVVIIGILAVIAIPTFLQQREKAWTRAVESDLRNSATVLEQWFGDNGTYGAVTGATPASPTLKNSEGVTLTTPTATATEYCIVGSHGKLTGKAWRIKSSVGRVEAAASTTTPCA